jgi:exportin-7
MFFGKFKCNFNTWIQIRIQQQIKFLPCRWVIASPDYLGKKSRIGGQSLVESDPLLAVINMRPEILQQMLQTVLNIIMFEDCRNQWSMSRPLLGLILLNEEYFQNLRDQIVSSQPLDKRGPMMSWFDNLMEGIERNLLTKNRDR